MRDMKKLILQHNGGEVIEYANNYDGSLKFSHRLEALIHAFMKLLDQRNSLKYGLKLHKREFRTSVLDHYGVDVDGNLLYYKSQFTIHPTPTCSNFDVASGNAQYLVTILKKNCYHIKKHLNIMREIVDEMNSNDIDFSDMLNASYVNCERLYITIQPQIGFLASDLVVAQI